MPCIDQCYQYKANKPSSGSRYANGQKYSSHCALFVNWDGVRCPCCKYNLKTSTKNQKYKIEAKRI